MSDQHKHEVHKEPYTSESGYSKFISHEQMDPAKTLGDAAHHPEHHSSGYSEFGHVVDPTHNVDQSEFTPHHTDGPGTESGSAQSGHDHHVHHEGQEHHETTYSQYISHEAHNPEKELGDAAHHPKRAETLYSQHGHVVDRTHNAED